MKKKGLAYALTAAMVLSLAAPATFAAEQPDSEETKTTLALAVETEAGAQTEAGVQAETGTETVPEAETGIKNEGEKGWQTDIRMALTRENALWKEAGMSVSDWDDAVRAKKQEGEDSPLTKSKVLEAAPDAQILEENGTVYFIDKAEALGEVSDALDAYRAAYSVRDLMGGNELADLRLWHQMDIDDIRIYSFQQVSESEMVMGSTLKIAVKDGRVIGISGSLDPEAGLEESVLTQAEIEKAVRDLLDNRGDDSEILSEYTDRVRHCPTVLADLDLDLSDDDPVPEQLRWVVYTKNDGDAQYPYTAHYIQLDGHYIDSLEVEEPGSDEALCGYRKQKVFDGMTADTWTGEIKGKDDKVKTVTLPVMRDEEGHLYLGDVNRRIAVADFAKAVYDEDHPLELVQSDENAVFDNEDLYMYYNYLNAWNFYSDMGWIGPDGEGTDVIILKNLCTRDGFPYENACSIGSIQGWQMFGYTAYTLSGEPLQLGHGQDVMAHEYTHTFTSTLMHSNLYENDQGAINEAMSDIMGNLAEYIFAETDDTIWLLGENTGSTVRSMSDPVAYQQPTYVWDKFYGPQTDVPGGANDRGGVHINSSLLNYIAARLCLDYGMEYEDAVRFWVMVAGGLTPKTDYLQICALMRWALKESGNEDQMDNLERMISEEHLEREEIPEKLPYNRKIVHLDIPENETFADENWALMAFQLNTETIGNTAMTLVRLAMQMIGDGTDAEEVGRILSDYLNNIHLDGNRIELNSSDDGDAVADAVADALTASIARLVEQSTAWSSTAGGDITFVTDDHPTLYALINVSNSGTKINGAAVLIGNRWVDLGAFLKIVEQMQKEAAGGGETEAETEKASLVGTLTSITPEQWETLFEVALAVYDAIHPDQSGETKEDASLQELLFEDILDIGLALMDYAGADEEEKADGLLLPARTQELPTEGLDQIRLRKD